MSRKTAVLKVPQMASCPSDVNKKVMLTIPPLENTKFESGSLRPNFNSNSKKLWDLHYISSLF
jgi:hypothetical protein